MPTDPVPQLNAYVFATNFFLIDDVGFDYGTLPAPPPPSPLDGPQIDTNGLYLVMCGVSNGIARALLCGTTNGESYTLLSAENLPSAQGFAPNPPWLVEQDLTGAPGTNATLIQVPTFGRRNLFLWAHTGPDSGPRVLFVQILGITNGVVSLGIYGTSPAQTYEILSKQNLGDPEWASEGTVAGQTNWTPAAVAIGTRTDSLFLQVRCWMDSDGSGLPDWWQLKYFSQTGVDPYADPDGDGWSNLQEFQNGTHPRQFNTPPAPTGLAVTYFGPSTNVTFSWTPSSGSVTGYVVQRYPAWTGQEEPLEFSPISETAFVDPSPPYGYDHVGWNYRVRALYASGPSSWTAWASIYNPHLCAMGTRIVHGPQGRFYLVVPSPPPELAAVRVYVVPQPWTSYPITYAANYLAEERQEYAPSTFSSLFDVPVASLQNGVYELPLSDVPLYGAYHFDLQGIGTDGSGGDREYMSVWVAEPGEISSEFVPFPFLDGREQIKQNVEFLLRAATGTNACYEQPGQPFNVDFARDIPPYGQQTIAEPGHATYVSSGFHFYNMEWYGSGWAMDPLRPFEQNCFYANFLFSLANVFHDQLLTGAYFDDRARAFGTQNPTSFFPTHSYISCGGTNAIPALLSTHATQWIMLRNFVDEFGAPDCVSGPYIVPTDFPNLYGLRLRSIRRWILGSTDPFPVARPGDAVTNFREPYFFEVERPQLATVDYYFARSYVVEIETPGGWEVFNIDARPGEPSFEPSLASPLMIAPFGESFFLSAWAKQAVLNGFTNVFAYPEQYFEGAYTIDSCGAVTTNTAGILSPYGEFLPAVPGPVALVTMPDGATGSQGTGVVNVIKLQLDVNHDGVMDLSFGGPDNTSQARPFVFWINNDWDISDPPGEPGHDRTGQSRDCQDPFINSQRDLEDFARLWICGLPALPTNGSYGVTLSISAQSGNPAINLFGSVETNGGVGYLTNASVAAAQVASTGPFEGPDWAIATITSDQPFTFPANFFTNNANKYFLFEGADVGSGQLVLTISQATTQGTNVIAQTGAWLDLHDIKDCYETADITNNYTGAVSNWTSGARTVQRATVSDATETQDLIVLVHGINVDYWHWANASETVCKRLYWAGYHGKFATVKWPCEFLNAWAAVKADTSVFNRSELKAYKASTALATYLAQLRGRFPSYRLHLLVHSQGNAVVSEALRQSGVTPDTYILTQGALPDSCYDVAAPTDSTLLNPEFLYGTPDWQPTGYHGVYTNFTARLVNFYNFFDPVLDCWKADQVAAKPDGYLKNLVFPTPFYTYDGTNGWHFSLTLSSYLVTDPQEYRAFIARSRTLPIGQSGPAAAHGVIKSAVDLNAQFGFYNVFPGDHSAQWVRPIQTTRPYFQQVLTSCQIQPAP